MDWINNKMLIYMNIYINIIIIIKQKKLNFSWFASYN